jgi:hypothetical protein
MVATATTTATTATASVCGIRLTLILERSIVERLVGADAERNGTPMQIVDRDVVARAFQFADLRRSQADAIGERLLRQVERFAVRNQSLLAIARDGPPWCPRQASD